MKRAKTRRIAMVALTLAVAAVATLNMLAYRHAYAMMHYAVQGKRTESPERLSGWRKMKVLVGGVNIPKPVNTNSPSDFGLAYETHTVPVSAGVRLEAWYVRHASPKGLILMFPGYSMAKASQLAEAKTFFELGYSVFMSDFRGSGGSNGRVVTMGYLEAQDVAGAVNYVRSALVPPPDEPLVLYGQSMGAAAILRAVACLGVEPSSVVLEAVFDNMLTTVRNRFKTMGVPSFPFAELLVFWGGRQTGFPGFSNNPAEYAARVHCPVLFMHGTDDPRVTLGQAQHVFDALPGPKQLVVFQGVKHESYLDAKPTRWKAVVRGFLDSTP